MDTSIDALSPSANDGRAQSLRDAVLYHLMYSGGEATVNASVADWRLALSRAVRDRVVGPWFDTAKKVMGEDRKRVYYLSMEFLIGRLIEDAILNMGLEDEARDALASLGADYETVIHDEPDAALGNGGLGRLAACFLDSMSTVGIAAYGYGIRYHDGLFKQSFNDGWQAEEAEDWLTQGHAWEFERMNAIIPISFGGAVSEDGGKATWTPAETVLACAYDTPTPGWQGRWVNTLRLWSAQSTEAFNLEPFNRGDFIGAATSNVVAETISRVLYPDDTTEAGRELRLKQEFFFTAASIRDLVQRFQRTHNDIRQLPNKVAIQLNDTHPAIAGPELMRVLIDEHGLDFDEAWTITRGTLNYTNHTLMPEALEKWSSHLMGNILPRHMQLIERIDDAHAREVKAAGKRRSDDVSIVHNDEVRMGNLAFIGARRVNGVSQLHTDLMRETVFKELHDLHPDRIVSMTNGVTPRRWLRGCNPALSTLLDEVAGPDWVFNLEQLQAINTHADDAAFRDRFQAAKHANKQALASYLKERTGIDVDPSAMFDIQIKRIHEYKRQLMNILEAAAVWNEIRDNPNAEIAPRVRIFGGKAAPGYAMAKQIIKLINDIAKTVNADPAMAGRLSIVYAPNYNVSMAERLIPAADLSEQISTAGMEASGTGNMKLAMNGALTIGTLDGANVEIRDHVGPENIFIFGKTAEEVQATRDAGYEPSAAIEASLALGRVVKQIRDGVFSPDDPSRFHGLLDNLCHHDWFMVAADFQAYYDCQREVDAVWRDQEIWTKRAIINTGSMGWFSSDRTVRGYARDIWNAEATL